MSEQIENLAVTTLAADVAIDDATIDVADSSGFPTDPEFRLVAGNEIMLVTAGDGSPTWEVDRGVEGTAPATHHRDDLVSHVLTAAALKNLLADAAAGGAGLQWFEFFNVPTQSAGDSGSSRELHLDAADTQGTLDAPDLTDPAEPIFSLSGGTYLVSCSVAFDTNPDGYRTVLAATFSNPDAIVVGIAGSGPTSGEALADNGDYIGSASLIIVTADADVKFAVVVHQSSGGALDVVDGYLDIVRL